MVIGPSASNAYPEWVPWFSVSPKGEILAANPAFLSLLGCRDSTLPAESSIHAIVPDHYRALLEQHTRAVLSRGESTFWHTEIVRRDGTNIPVLLGAHLASDGHLSCICLELSRFDNRTFLGRKLLDRFDQQNRLLARELHDTTAQNLAALAMTLSVIAACTHDSTKLTGLVAECAALTEHCLAEVRTLAYRLQPPLLEELGLESALRTYCHSFTRQTSIPVEIHFPKPFERPGTEAESCIFRVIEERLKWIEQNGDATECTLHIEQPPGRCIATLWDNGSQESPNAQIANSDLATSLDAMRERVEAVGGSLTLDSDSQGTRIRAIIAPKL
jgi:PAS domain S-box-containing protein